MKRSSMLQKLENLFLCTPNIDIPINTMINEVELAREVLALVEYEGMLPPSSFEETKNDGAATHVLNKGDGICIGAIVVNKWEDEK